MGQWGPDVQWEARREGTVALGVPTGRPRVWTGPIHRRGSVARGGEALSWLLRHSRGRGDLHTLPHCTQDRVGI